MRKVWGGRTQQWQLWRKCNTFVHFICQSGTLTLMLLQREQRKIKRKQIQRRLSQFERSIICHYETALRLSHPPAPYLWHSYLYGCHTFSPSSGPCDSSSWGEAGCEAEEGRGAYMCGIFMFKAMEDGREWEIGIIVGGGWKWSIVVGYTWISCSTGDKTLETAKPDFQPCVET